MKAMTHIKRKFQKPIDNPNFDKLKKLEVTNPEDFKVIKHNDFDYAFMIIEDGTQILTYKYQKSKKEFLYIPEPEPVLIYFNNAQANLKRVYQTRDELLRSCEEINNGLVMGHNVYNFMYHASSFSIFLFTAIEATINKAIPADYKFRRKNGNKMTEEYDIDQIQRYISFSDKIKKVLPEITKKDFLQSHSSIYSQIDKLKDFRDLIIHTKSEGGNPTYGGIIKTALDFNYELTIKAVQTFINYYFPGLVEECDCGRDE